MKVKYMFDNGTMIVEENGYKILNKKGKTICELKNPFDGTNPAEFKRFMDDEHAIGIVTRTPEEGRDGWWSTFANIDHKGNVVNSITKICDEKPEITENEYGNIKVSGSDMLDWYVFLEKDGTMSSDIQSHPYPSSAQDT